MNKTILSLLHTLNLKPASIAAPQFIQESARITGQNGHLATIIQRPASTGFTTTPVVILCHGFTSNKDDPIIKGLADALQKQGVASVRFDFDGRGESDGLLKDMTVSKELKDVTAVIKWVKKQPWSGPLAVAGHSQGGVITELMAANAGKKFGLSAIVLLSPAAIMRDNSLVGFIFWEQFDPSNPPKTITIKGDKIIGRNYLVENQSLPIYETAHQWTGSVCIIHGTEDSIVPYTYSNHFKEIWPKASLHLIPGADHLYSIKKDRLKAIALATDFLTKKFKK